MVVLEQKITHTQLVEGILDGYVIDNCSSRMLNFSGTTEKHPEV